MHGRTGKIGGVKRNGVRRTGDQINRSIAPLCQPHARDDGETAGLDRLCRAMEAAPQIERPQSGKSFGIARLRKRHEMHHDAACEPHREQQAKCDAQPAVQQNERANHRTT